MAVFIGTLRLSLKDEQRQVTRRAAPARRRRRVQRPVLLIDVVDGQLRLDHGRQSRRAAVQQGTDAAARCFLLLIGRRLAGVGAGSGGGVRLQRSRLGRRHRFQSSVKLVPVETDRQAAGSGKVVVSVGGRRRGGGFERLLLATKQSRQTGRRGGGSLLTIRRFVERTRRTDRRTALHTAHRTGTGVAIAVAVDVDVVVVADAVGCRTSQRLKVVRRVSGRQCRHCGPSDRSSDSGRSGYFRTAFRTAHGSAAVAESLFGCCCC